MKILHTSDWHLGLDFYGRSLHDDQLHMIESIAQIAKEHQVGAVMICGDVFDRAVVSADAMELYNIAMHKLCLEAGVKVILCAGNHDGASRLASLSSLLTSAGLHIFGRMTAQDAAVDLGDAVVHVLPYLNTDDARTAYPDQREGITSAVDAMRVVLGNRVPDKSDGKRHILMAHCFAAGGRIGQSDRAAAAGGALAVPTQWFAAYDYVALGHLHRPQNLSGANARYCGTPLCYSFAEADQQKSVTLLDTQDMSVQYIPLQPLRAVRAISGTMEQLMGDRSDDYLQVTVVDQYATSLVQEQVRTRYPFALLIEGGKQAVFGSAPMLTMEEAANDTPLDIAEKFYLYKTGEEMDDEQRAWFSRAIEDAHTEKEG